LADASSGAAAEEWRRGGEAPRRDHIGGMSTRPCPSPVRHAPRAAALLLLLAGGCVAGSPASRQSCRDAGHAPGSDAFVSCLAAADRDAVLGANDRPY
jgi:hypothetical protein